MPTVHRKIVTPKMIEIFLNGKKATDNQSINH